MIASAIIARQLGGQRFRAMTGGQFIYSEANTNRLQVNFRSSKGVNRMIIELQGDDTYTVEFGYYRALKYFQKETLVGVYAEQLQEIFTNRTGLYTSL